LEANEYSAKSARKDAAYKSFAAGI
jgi:hypothetical protein